MKDQAKRDAQTVQIASTLFAVTLGGTALYAFAVLVGFDRGALALLLGVLLVVFLYRVVRVARPK